MAVSLQQRKQWAGITGDGETEQENGVVSQRKKWIGLSPVDEQEERNIPESEKPSLFGRIKEGVSGLAEKATGFFEKKRQERRDLKVGTTETDFDLDIKTPESVEGMLDYDLSSTPLGPKQRESAKMSLTLDQLESPILDSVVGGIEETGLSLKAGTGGVVSGTGMAANWLGYEGLGDRLVKKGGEWQNYAPETPEDLKKFNWKDIQNPRFWTTQVARGVPFTIAALPLFFAGATITSAVTAAAGITGLSAVILNTIGAGVLPTVFEASIEAGGVYDESLRRGMSKEDADKAADKTFKGTATILGISNSLQFLPFLRATKADDALIQRMVSSNSGWIKKTAKGVALFGLESGTEGAEEVAQEAVAAEALGDEFNLLDMETQRTFALGAAQGIAFSAGGVIVDTSTGQNKTKEFVDMARDDAQDTVERIKDKTLDKAGLGEMTDVAKHQQLEKIAKENPDLIREATKEVLGEKIAVEEAMQQQIEQQEAPEESVEISEALEPLAQEAKGYDSEAEFVSDQIFSKTIPGEIKAEIEASYEGETFADKLSSFYENARQEVQAEDVEVPEGLGPLAQEARNYDSVEEFIESSYDTVQKQIDYVVETGMEDIDTSAFSDKRITGSLYKGKKEADIIKDVAKSDDVYLKTDEALPESGDSLLDEGEKVYKIAATRSNGREVTSKVSEDFYNAVKNLKQLKESVPTTAGELKDIYNQAIAQEEARPDVVAEAQQDVIEERETIVRREQKLDEVIEEKIDTTKNINDVQSTLKSVRERLQQAVTEAEGMAVVAREQRAGINTEDVALLKRVYANSDRFQAGDIETMRAYSKKSRDLVNRVIENVQEAHPEMGEREAFDFALDLPTKRQETPRNELIRELEDKEKKLSEYLDQLKEKQKELKIQEDDALSRSWVKALSLQEDLISIIRVPDTRIPLGKGPEKVSRLEARVRGKLDEFTPGEIDELGLSTYNQVNNKDNVAKASEYVANNPNEAIRVVKGEISPPKGVLVNSVYVALKELGSADTEIATRVASLASTRYGQEISVLQEIDTDSPVTLMEEIVKTRIEAFEKRTGEDHNDKIKQEVEKIEKELKVPNNEQWDSFLEEIRC